MTFYKNRKLIVFLFFMLSAILGLAQIQDLSTKINIENQLKVSLVDFVNSDEFNALTGHFKKDSSTINALHIDSINRIVNVFFDDKFLYAPIRQTSVNKLRSIVLTKVDSSYQTLFFSDGKNIKEYIPNYFQIETKDSSRSLGRLQRTTKPIVQNASNPYQLNTSLNNINIALWNSHGWYYESKLNRWEWQRARLFNTVEDLYPTIYILNYLLPMLENAGANVFLPRERSWQTNEIIVDNDDPKSNDIIEIKEKHIVFDSGYATGHPPYIDENPFRLGTSLSFETKIKGADVVEWIPDIPEDGIYPVYVAYHASPENTDATIYVVYHSGGMTEYKVNQQMGGGTWIYLGDFTFEKGVNSKHGKVVLLNTGDPNHFVSADAVRFGGGMGNISRNGLMSKRPRYQEAARYYLQYAGFPDSLVWKQNTNNDYADDRLARGDWVNYLMGAPNGPRKDSSAKGLGIPIDLTLALHTDAGITSNDSVIGTLGIYNTKMDSNIFPSGLSKMASRDLTDIIQSQVVDDIRIKYDSNWVRRDLWDKAYTEAVRPNTPTMMLELLSHQNFMDVRFGKEPTFQFDVSRAIYKGMLKFLNALYDIPYIVQPLPVTHFQAEFTNNNKIQLNWKAQIDTLEPSANAEAYIVYMRKDEGGFDNGTLVKTNEYIFDEIDYGVIYSFKVAAVNAGGESFPSEELAVCMVKKSKGTILIVNAFDRLGGPAFFNDDSTAGFLDNVDEGVPYRYDFYTTGSQYDFNKNSPWLDDDSPGFGASYANMEDKIKPGNTFNFSFIHGKSIRNADYSFVSVSDEALVSGNCDVKKYKIIDFLAGEEKTSYLPKNDSVPYYQIFTDDMLAALRVFLNAKGSLFISGAHIATDAHINGQDTEIANLLKYKWRTNNASKTGEFYFMNENFSDHSNNFIFNTDFDTKIYKVESADALEPADGNTQTLLRYAENNMSAGIMHKDKYKIVALGFPFETILDTKERDLIMAKILDFFNEK